MASKFLNTAGADIATTLASFTGFLNHYGAELGNTVGILETLVGAVPVAPATKSSIDAALETLKAGVVGVTEAANSLEGIATGSSNGGEVVVNEADIDAAVSRVAGPLIDAAVRQALAAANAGNGGSNG
jgi:hypothetical protein